MRGPDRDKGGFDAATYLSRGGVSYTMTPFGTETPAVQGPGFGDLQGGITLAGGVCAALFHRERTGEPSIVDSSLLAQAMWTIAPSISVADLFDIDGIPGAPPGLAINPLVNRYKTRDGRFIQLVFLQPDRYWAGFCERIGLPELAADERFVPSSNLIANTDGGVRSSSASGSPARTSRTGTRCSPTNRACGRRWPHRRRRSTIRRSKPNGYVIPNVDDHGNEYQIVAAPVQFDETPPRAARAPEHGQHTEEILLELDLDWDDISAAKDSGAIL